ncbi:MAG: nicotinate phosphoribosyltransferase, partial [bacterium]
IEPTGTIPHALVILMGDSVRATTAFNEIIDARVPRVALVDTFGDEKFESMAVAEALGKDLYGVRLDTTSSRRGDFARILEEVRWELDLRGHGHVRLFASGGITERNIAALNPVVDAYGIGTSITAAPTVDYALDIVEVQGKPVAKRGKRSGAKDFYRCADCLEDIIVPLDAQPPPCRLCGRKAHPLLVTAMENGRRTSPPEAPAVIREKVLRSLERLDVEPI